MDISKIGTLFIAGPEEFIAGNDMVFTAVFKKPLKQNKLFESYQELILRYPALHSALINLKNQRRFVWKRLDTERLNELLIHEKKHLEHNHDLRKIYSAYYPTNRRLPFRITQVNEKTLIFSLNHAYSNGRGALAWIEEWLRCYLKRMGRNPPGGLPAGYHEARVQKRQASALYFNRIKPIFWAGIYLAQFYWRARGTANVKTVDLTIGGRPKKNRSGYNVRTYSFSTQETAWIIRKSKMKNQTVTEFLGTVLAHIFFKDQPQKNRLCISVPVDIRSEVAGVTLYSLGNYTSSLIVQIFKREDIAKQVSAAFAWFKRKVPYGLAKIIELTIPNEHKIKNTFEHKASLSLSERTPLENFTFALSNPGIIKSPLLEKMIDRISAHGKTRTILFTALTLNNKLSIEVCLSNDLFHSDEVFSLTDRLAEEITRPCFILL